MLSLDKLNPDAPTDAQTLNIISDGYIELTANGLNKNTNKM